MEIIERKADNLFQSDDKAASLECYKLLHEIILELQQKLIVNEESKYFLSQQSKKMYEAAIKVAIANDDLEQAYQFSQSSRSMILLQQIQEKQAIKATGIPESVMKKGNAYKFKVYDLLKKREEAILKEDSKLIQEYNDAIFGQNKKYEGWMEELEIDYPSFYELKYDFPEVSIKELKKDLGRKETTLIEYFLGDKNLYIFIIDENGIHVDVQEINKAFHENITVVNNGLNQLDYSFESFTKYHQSAHALFNTLLGVSIKQKWIKNENLIIIRDEQLNLVPFEALISKPYVSKEEDVLYGRLDYLLNDYYISYLYSSNLIGNKSKYSKSKKFLGIAPSFENPNIQKLEYNQEEINRINAFYNDEVLKDKKATYASFMNKIQGRDIVHFATHAIFNDEIPLDSRIELADTSLYIYEIFSLPHDLQLAVLSACQTASGKSRKGEGIISLSRSFVQSGCPSVVASLWDVSDQRASDLLTYFHENLVKGNERKDVSLAEAKRKYLIESVSVNTHPFLWAGFIQIGDVSPIISSNNNFIYWLLGILFILLILFLIYRKMK